MKKTILKNLLLVIAVGITLVSCKKNDDAEPTPIVYPEENLIDGYLSATNFSQVNNPLINAGDYEFGLEFTPMVKGKITKLTAKLPDVRTNLRVTIWDKVAGTKLRTEVVNVAAANTAYTFDIADLDLEKDKMYTITMNSNDWYERKKTDGTVTTYPITTGNIKINGYKWLSGTTQTYPTTVSNNYYAGDCFFLFQQTN